MKTLTAKLRGFEHLEKKPSKTQEPALIAFEERLELLKKEGDRFLVTGVTHRKAMELRLSHFRERNRDFLHVASVNTREGWMIFVVWSCHYSATKQLDSTSGRVAELIDLDQPF